MAEHLEQLVELVKSTEGGVVRAGGGVRPDGVRGLMALEDLAPGDNALWIPNELVFQESATVRWIALSPQLVPLARPQSTDCASRASSVHRSASPVSVLKLGAHRLNRSSGGWMRRCWRATWSTQCTGRWPAYALASCSRKLEAKRRLFGTIYDRCEHLSALCLSLHLLLFVSGSLFLSPFALPLSRCFLFVSGSLFISVSLYLRLRWWLSLFIADGFPHCQHRALVFSLIPPSLSL